MFKIFKKNQGIRKIVDQVSTIILTLLVLYTVYNLSSEFKSSYLGWNDDYTDFFSKQVPTAYKDTVTLDGDNLSKFEKFESE